MADWRHGSDSGWIDADKIGESGVGLIASLRRSGVPITDPAGPGSDSADEGASIRPKSETSPPQHEQSPSTPPDRLSMSDFPMPIRPSERLEYRRKTHFIPFSFIIAGLLWLLFVLPILAWHGEGVMIMGLLLIVPLIMLVVVLRSPVIRWLKYMADDEHAASIAKPPGGDSKQPRDADDGDHD